MPSLILCLTLALTAPLWAAAPEAASKPNRGATKGEGRAAARPTKAAKAAKPAPEDPLDALFPAKVALSTVPISVIYPPEGLTMAMASGEVILGSVSNPNVPFRINGKPVKPHRLGGFLAFPPVSPGSFTFLCELDLPGGTTSLARTIVVTPPLAPASPEPVRIEAEARFPAVDLELKAGDWLNVQFKGSNGGKAEFSLVAGKRRLPMVETNSALGLYQGVYQVRPEDEFESQEIEFFLRGADGTASAKAKGRLTVREGPSVALVRSSGPVVVKTGPGNGYLAFPPIGTRFLVGGRVGSEAKVLLSPDQSGWVEASALNFLPQGAHPPRGVLSTLKAAPAPDGAVVTLAVSDQVPFELEESPDLRTLTVRLYNAVGYTNWMVYDSSDTFVEQMRWRQEDTNTAVVTLHLTQRLWGYRGQWEGGVLRLDLRRPPLFAPKGESAFKGITVVVDAGHQPSSRGATGPRGLAEKDANLAIAKALERQLEKEGAKVVMTRTGDDEVGLSERPRLAWEKRGDLFLSVHNNAIGDGEDPYGRPRGFSVFYYHPHSFDLGRSVHRAYRRRIPLPDEGLRYGNLLVARLTEMPAILVESAYMILPEQEALLLSPRFHRRLASSMAEGAREFLERARDSGRPRPAAEAFAPPAPEPEPELAAQKPSGAKGARPRPRRKKP